MTTQTPLTIKNRSVTLMTVPVIPNKDTNLFDSYAKVEMIVKVNHNSLTKKAMLQALIVAKDESGRFQTEVARSGCRAIKLCDMPRYSDKKLLSLAESAQNDPQIQALMQHNAGISKVSFVTLP